MTPQTSLTGGGPSPDEKADGYDTSCSESELLENGEESSELGIGMKVCCSVRT